jgi:hypothetical protein
MVINKLEKLLLLSWRVQMVVVKLKSDIEYWCLICPLYMVKNVNNMAVLKAV